MEQFVFSFEACDFEGNADFVVLASPPPHAKFLERRPVHGNRSYTFPDNKALPSKHRHFQLPYNKVGLWLSGC